MTEQTLFQQNWNDDTPLDQIPLEHRARVEQERAQAAATATAVKKAAKAGAGAKTRARVPAGSRSAKPGARARKSAAVEESAPEPDRVTIVLTTSRYRGRDGRRIARRTPVLVLPERGIELLMKGDAREHLETDKLAVAYLD